MENNSPKGWIELSFTKLLDVQGGTQPPKSTFMYAPKKDYIRLLQIRDFGEKPHPTYIPFRTQLKTCKKDDILIARYGASLGRIVTGMEGAYNVALAKVIIPEEINKRYVLYLLKSEIFQRPILANERSAQDGFNKDDLERIQIPLPPLPEQQRIAEKLDALMARISNSKTRLEKIPTLLKNFRQSVLAAAVSGELTKKWREVNNNIESVFQLLDKIEKQRKSDYKKLLEKLISKGQKKPRQPENLEPKIFKDPDLPDTWGKMTFSDISSIISYSMTSGPFGSALGTKDYIPIGIPVIRGQNIQPEGFVNKGFVYVSKEKANDLKRSSAYPDDIVIVAVGAGVGNSAIVPNDLPIAILSQNCNKFTIDKNLAVPKFILFSLQVSILKDQMNNVTTDTARQFLSLTNLKELYFSIPPLKEQNEIIRNVGELFHFTDSIEARYQKAKAWFGKLPQSILAKAFRGELVPQNENDEPASVLLEKIKKEKHAINKPKSKAKQRKMYEGDDKLSLVAEE